MKLKMGLLVVFYLLPVSAMALTAQEEELLRTQRGRAIQTNLIERALAAAKPLALGQQPMSRETCIFQTGRSENNYPLDAGSGNPSVPANQGGSFSRGVI